MIRRTLRELEIMRKFTVEKRAVCGGVLAVCVFSVVFVSVYLGSVSGELTVKEESLLFGGSDSMLESFDISDNVTEDSSWFSYAGMNHTDDLEYPSELCDYVLWRNESSYFARNGLTGDVEFSGSDITPIVENIVSGSTDGLLLCFKKGVYVLSSTIDIAEKSDIRIVGAGKELTKFVVSSDIAAFNITGNSESHNLRFEISGCLIDGGGVSSTKYGLFMKHMDSIQLHDLAVTCFDTHVYVEDCQKPSVYNVVVWSNTKFQVLEECSHCRTD